MFRATWVFEKGSHRRGFDNQKGNAVTIKLGLIQTKNRTFSYKVNGVEQALIQVNANIENLVHLAAEAGAQGCDIIAFPEDTLGTLEWETGHWDQAKELLVPAVAAMQEKLGGSSSQVRHGHNLLQRLC
jgi:hypothetical protein